MFERFMNRHEFCLHIRKEEYLKEQSYILNLVRRTPLAFVDHFEKGKYGEYVICIRSPFRFINRHIIKRFNKAKTHGKIVLGDKPKRFGL